MEENDATERGRWCTERSHYTYSVSLTFLGLVIAGYEVSIANHTSGVVPDRAACDGAASTSYTIKYQQQSNLNESQ